MTTDFYSHGGYPATGAAGTSAAMRSELDLVEAGFAKLAALSGNGSKFLRVNSGATAYEALDVPSAVTALFAAVISPTQITSDQNDYNPTSLSTATAVRISTDASRNITGMQGGTAGRLLLIANAGSFNAVLKAEDAGSSAANRFALTYDLTLLPGWMALLWYDSTSSRWRAQGLQASAFIQTLLDDADAATARTTLDVPSNATLTALVPAGVILDYAGTSTPSGFLLCDGSNVSRTTYSGLFSAIGTTWGAGDGSTTFTLPDTRRRVSVGKGGSGTGTLGSAVGNTGGAETHTLSTGELAAHGHTFSGTSDNISADHTHNLPDVALRSDGEGLSWVGGTSIFSSGRGGTTSGASNGHTHTYSGTTANNGSGTAHNNLQPSYVVTKIIKT